MAVAASNTQILEGLYAAIYVRSPDKAGFDFWTAGFTAGTLTPGSAATAFSTRTEWATAYPSTLTDAAYVDKIYLNVLGIAGDAAGRAFWTANITAKAYTRAVFVSEFIAATIQYDSAADTTSTAAQKASAVQAQSAINSKISFNDAWVTNTAVSTNSAMTGVSTDATGAAIYTASLDKSVALLAGVTDAPSLATQLPKITAAANAGGTFSLTTGTDTLTALTAMNDTVTGGDNTLGSDVIVDNTTTDADVLTATGVAATTKPTIQNIETVNISGSTSTGLDVTGLSAVKVLNLSTTTTGSASVTNAKVGATASIVAGANITALTVATATTGTGGDLAVNTGTAPVVTLTAAAGVDSIALTTTGDVTVKAGASMALETLKLTANPVAAVGTAAAATPVITLDNSSQLITFTAGTPASIGVAEVPSTGGVIQVVGAGDVEIKADIAAISGRTVAKGAGNLALTLSGTAATADLANITATTINLGADLGAATVNLLDNRTLTTLTDQTDLKIGKAGISTVVNKSATLTSLSSASLKTLTINSSAPDAGVVDATYGTISLVGDATTVLAGANFAGTKLIVTGGATATPQDVKVSTGKVETVDASALIGTIDYMHSNIVGALNAATATTMEKFTFTGSAGADKLAIMAPATNTFAKATITATLGDGNDTVTLPAMSFVSGSILKIDGGLGTGDTLVLKDKADVSQANLTLTGMENIAFDTTGGKITMSAALISGATYAVKGSTALTDNFVVKSLPATTAVDLTKLVLDGTVETITIDGSAGTVAQTLAGINSLALTTVKNVIIGGAGNDTISGGVSSDVITGGLGIDSLKGNLGADTFQFSSVTADSTATGFDTISDFKVSEGDKIAITVAPAADGSTVLLPLLNIAPSLAKALPVATNAAINVNSVATFVSTETTLAAQITSVNNALGTSPAGTSVIWASGGDTYMLTRVGATAAAGDVVVKIAATTPTTLADFVTGVTAVSTGPTIGNDVITGTAGYDDGSTGNGAILDGLAGNDTLTGLGGNDQFRISLGTDIVTDLGFGADELVVSANATGVTATLAGTWKPTATTDNGLANTAAIIKTNGFSADLTAAKATAATNAGWTITNAGSTVAVTLTGSTAADIITGGDGADTIVETTTALLFADSINGGTGTDTLSVGNTTTTAALTFATTDTWTNISDVEKIVVPAAAVAIDISLPLAAQTSGITTVDLSKVVTTDTVKINLSLFTDTTKSLTLTGASTATTILGGAGGDSITGGAGIDVITAGKGADSITITETTNTIDKIVQDNGDSVAFTASTLGTTIAAGNTITFGNGVDVITGFQAGTGKDTLDVTTAGAAAVTGIGMTAASLTATKTMFLSGAYNATTKVFTVAADGIGADTLIEDTADTAAATADTWVVLVGVNSTNLQANNFI